VVTVICPSCRAEVSLPPRRLLVRVDAGRATTGELLFTCLSCGDTAAVAVDAAALAALLLSGATHLSLTPPVAEHPEGPPAGPPLTHDDLLDLHRALTSPQWFAELEATLPCE
jgi:hypothetical protein